jgi:hypothetical protein
VERRIHPADVQTARVAAGKIRRSNAGVEVRPFDFSQQFQPV